MSATPAFSSSRSAAAEVCAFAPLGVIALYGMLALYCRVWMGHWPRYYEYLAAFDSPISKIIGAAFLLWAIFSLLVAPVWWGALIWRTRPGLKPATRQAAIFIGSWLVFILLVIADPFGFTSFLID
jgi:hypothetical protein